MRRVPKDHPLRRWFAALVEDSFQQEIGLSDPRVLDYLASLLTEFIHVERINTLDDGSGRRVGDVAAILSKVEGETGFATDDDRRLFHQHIGDYTLFWTGIYPEVLRRMRRRDACDGLLSYTRQGKESYAIASDLSGDATDPPASILRALSEQFEYCVYGLGLVRKTWEQGQGPAGAGPGLVI